MSDTIRRNERKQKNALHYLHYGGESAESAESARQKNDMRQLRFWDSRMRRHPLLTRESIKCLKSLMQFFILPASDAGQWRKEETRDTIPRNYQERKSCLLGNGAGRSSSDRLSYRVIEKANLNRPCMVDAIWAQRPSRSANGSQERYRSAKS